MGMVLGLTSAGDETISAILADPPLIWRLLGAAEEVVDAARSESAGSWFSRLFSRSKPSSGTEPVEIATVEEIDLDKSWHGIHYLLTGSAWEGDAPLNFLVLGGAEVGQIDVGYGTARAFNSVEVKEISKALAAVDEQILLSRFSPAEMARLGIYPDIWEDDTDNAREYCTEYFSDLKRFVERTAAAGNGMVITIT